MTSIFLSIFHVLQCTIDPQLRSCKSRIIFHPGNGPLAMSCDVHVRWINRSIPNLNVYWSDGRILRRKNLQPEIRTQQWKTSGQTRNCWCYALCQVDFCQAEGLLPTHKWLKETPNVEGYVIKQIAVACLPSLNGAFTESLASAAAAMSATASLNTVLLRIIFQLLHIEKIHKSLNSLLCIHASPFPAFGCPYPVIVKWNFQSLNACEYSLSNGKIN